MINVLLVIRSYFDALHVASLLDWEANGYQLIMEMNAISGLRHLSDLRPDILLLHHDVGWLDADKYLSHIRSAYLPTQIIMLLGKRGGAARNKRQIALAKEIQVIEWEKLSAELLKNALHTANLYAVKTEEHNVAFEQKRFVKEATAEEQLAALQRSVLPDQMSLIRLVVAKKMQPHSTQEQIERAVETILVPLQYGYQFRDNMGDYCLLVKVEDNFLRYNRTAYLNDLAQRLLQSVKETLHTEAYVSICYQAASSALMEEMAMLRRLGRYTSGAWAAHGKFPQPG